MSRAVFLAACLWASFGLRFFLVRTLDPVPLTKSFNALPMGILGQDWVGQDMPLDDDVLERSKVSDYVQRTYRRGGVSLWIYVGYVNQWKPEAIHHPEICFPANGFVLTNKGDVTLEIPGVAGESRFKESLWTHPRGAGTYTLTAFYYNGKLEPEEWRLRRDSLKGIPYFAIVTYSGDQVGDLEETRKLYQGLLRQSLPQVLQHFAPAR